VYGVALILASMRFRLVFLKGLLDATIVSPVCYHCKE